MGRKQKQDNKTGIALKVMDESGETLSIFQHPQPETGGRITKPPGNLATDRFTFLFWGKKRKATIEDSAR